jgi:hypothetical protein
MNLPSLKIHVTLILRAGGETPLEERAFDLERFYSFVEAPARERSPLRQDIVRGLKDYYCRQFGYDVYGAETVLQVSEAMTHPFIYGFAASRILHDRRISDRTKIATAARLLDTIQYGQNQGLPFGLFTGLRFLMSRDQLPPEDLRYALVASAGEHNPFTGTEKSQIIDFISRLASLQALPPPERALWGHSLIERHGDGLGEGELVDRLLSEDTIPVNLRRELCWAWINFRQPRIEVEIPDSRGTRRGRFVLEHMPFWVTHTPSWPSLQMVRRSLVWLARLGEDPLHLAETYIDYHDSFADQVHAGVADILAEHSPSMPTGAVRRLVEHGIGMTGSVPTRRRFYRLGTELFGTQYLERASADTANSVRQWAVKQLQKQA